MTPRGYLPYAAAKRAAHYKMVPGSTGDQHTVAPAAEALHKQRQAMCGYVIHEKLVYYATILPRRFAPRTPGVDRPTVDDVRVEASKQYI